MTFIGMALAVAPPSAPFASAVLLVCGVALLIVPATFYVHLRTDRDPKLELLSRIIAFVMAGEDDSAGASHVR
jgi:hypothetical protein